MAIVWILLWTLGFMIIIKDYKTESTVWLASVAFITGLGAFSVVFQESALKYLMLRKNVGQGTINSIYTISAVMSDIVHYFTPYCMLIFGVSYADIVPKNKKKIIYSILLIPLILSFIFFPYKNNSLKTPDELISYFRKLSLWAVPYMAGGIIFTVYSYIKEKSYTVKKYKFLTLLIVVPGFSYAIIGNFILRDFGLENNWRFFIVLIPLIFTGFIIFAFKYGALGIRLRLDRFRFAFENILELVSDSFVILDENLNVIEFNKAFSKLFLSDHKKYKSFKELIASSRLSEYEEKFISMIDDSKSNNISSMEIEIQTENKYFEVNVTPIISNNEYFGTTFVFKDITVYKRNIELIKQNQIQLIEKERLLSLNQLIGGVAHNLKTPILSSSGGIHIIKKDTKKIYEYVKNNSSFNEIKESIDEMNDWEERIKQYLIYMSDVINTVKGQITDFNEIPDAEFSIQNFIKKITQIMNFECSRSKCVFINEFNIDYKNKIKGNINSLVQVINNLISNAIEASKENGRIIFGVYKESGNAIFYIKNFNNEIPEEIRSRIFNKMITTKGRKGTGLGLYISKLIVTSNLNGKIYFETNKKVTTFFVKIPLIEEEKHER